MRGRRLLAPIAWLTPGALAVLLALLAIACGGMRESLPQPGRYDERGLHVVAHEARECTVCALYARSKGFIVRIVSASGSGAGVVVEPGGRLVTNAHVVGNSQWVQVEAADGHTYLGRVVATEVGRDLAIVDTQSPGVTWATPRLHTGPPPPVSSDVYVIGHPLGLGWTVTRGTLTGFRREGGETLLQSNAPISPGNSGGPLVNAQGTLLGIVSSRLPIDGAEERAFAWPTASVLEFLASRKE